MRKLKQCIFIAVAMVILFQIGGIIVSADASQEEKIMKAKWSETVTKEKAHVCVEVWNALREHGVSEAGCAGVIGNIWQECRLNPTAQERIDGSGGYGLLQWTDPSRKQELKDTAEKMGGKVSDLNVQIAQIIIDIDNNSYFSSKGYSNKQVIEATDVKTATEVFCNSVERPSVPCMDARYAGAQTAYDALKGTKAGVSGSNNSGGSATSNTGITSTVESVESEVYSRGDSPFKDGRALDYTEQKSVDRITAELSNESNSARWSMVFTITALLGILLIVYSMALLIGFYIDIFNVFSEISVLGLLSFNSLMGVSSEAEKRGINKENGKTAVKVISHKDIWLIFGLGIIFSTLLLNGQAFLGLIIKIFNWVISLFT